MGRWLDSKPQTQGRWQATQTVKSPSSKFMTGAWYEKAFDPLMAGQYAIAGLGRKAAGLEDAGAIAGIKNRASWVDIAQEKYPYTPTADWKYNFLQEVKRVAPGTVADIALDPLWLIPPVKVAKMLGLTKAAKWVGKTKPMAWIGEKLGKQLVTRYKQPGEYVYLAKTTLREIARQEESALAIGKPISGLTRAEQKRVGQLIKGGISQSEIEKPLREVAIPAIKEFKRLGREAVQEGLLNERTFLENYGRYMPRLYRTKEMPEGAIRFFGDKKPVRIDLSRFKKRKDIPEDIRAAMGEIREAGYPTSKGLAQLGQAVERSKFFGQVAKNPEWASKVQVKGWSQLPETKALGKLSKNWVKPEIYEDIQQWIRVVSKGEKIYRTGIGLWKYGKVIANPATQTRNMMSNVILADMGGLSPLRVDIWGRGLLELKNKGKYYKELKANSDILYETFARREIMDLLGAFEKTEGINMFMKGRNMVSRLMKKGASLYQAEEQWAKMSLYILKREQGLTPIKAAKEAEKWLFNYREVPPLIEVLRGSRIAGGLGAALSATYPFITFSYKVTPRLVEIAWKNPAQLTKWMKMYRGVEQFTDAETIEKQRELLPEYMRDGMHLRLPFKDEYNRDLYLDLNFILPWGDIGEITRTLTPNHPLWSSLYALFLNKHPLGWDIVPPGASKQEAREAVTDYLYKAMLPSLSPEIPGVTKGGYGYQKVASAVRGEMDYSGKRRSVMSAIMASVFGVKTTPFELEEAEERKESETDRKIRDVQSRIRNLYRLEKRNIIDRKEFIKKEKGYQAQIKELGGKDYTPSDNWMRENEMTKAQPAGRWMKGQENITNGINITSREQAGFPFPDYKEYKSGNRIRADLQLTNTTSQTQTIPIEVILISPSGKRFTTKQTTETVKPGKTIYYGLQAHPLPENAEVGQWQFTAVATGKTISGTFDVVR